MYSLILVAVLLLLKESDAQYWRGRGGGGGGNMGGGQGGNMGGGNMGGGQGGNMGGGQGGGGATTVTSTTTTSTTTTSPMDIIQKLVQNRDSITRQVNLTEDGVKTFTSGATDQINTWINLHVEQMIALVESGGRIRKWDPLFQKLFQYADQHDLECTPEDNGTACTHTGENPCAIGLAQAHAEVVSLFLKNGRDEVMDSHEDYIPAGC